MSSSHTPIYINQTAQEEHDHDFPETKKVSLYGWDSASLQKRRIAVDSDGKITNRGAITYEDSSNLDAFSRLRVSDTGTRLDIEFNYDGQKDIVDSVIGGNGTDTYNANARHHLLKANGTATTDFAGLYTYDVPYTPGNSQLIAITGVLDFASIGGGVAQLFLRSSVTGSIVETVISQVDWDNPVADVDWTKSQIFEMDFQSLKVGRIRFYLNRGGVPVKVYEIINDNTYNTGYWAIPNHPAYWRIYNDATYTYMEVGYGDTNDAIGFRYRIAKNANASMTAICATVKSEGGSPLFDIVGFNRIADRNLVPATVSTTLIPLISIRPRTTFHSIANKSLVIPIDYSIQTDNSIRVVVIHNPTLTGASWTNVDTNESCVEYDVSATALTGGHKLNMDYVGTIKNTQNSNTGLMGRALLWNRRGTESGVLTLAAIRTTTTNASVLAGIRWSEIR